MSGNCVSVIGAGAWGTALALAFARAGRDVMLCGRDAGRMARIADTRDCGSVLPGVRLPETIRAVVDPAEASACPLIVMAVPTQVLWQVARGMAPLLPKGGVLLSASKGIERETGYFVTESLADAVGPGRFGVLSGPSFAADVARGLPTAIVLAMKEIAEAERLAQFLSSPSLRLYHSGDVRGVEIGGAAKNVLAIAAGIVAGAGLGESARAAMIARGFAELRRFAAAHGANPETLMGLSGLGDLVLTATSPQSRNYSLGLALGAGRGLRDANPEGKLAEGMFTATILAKMAAGRGVDMPLVSAVAAVLEERLTVRDAVSALMTRPLRGE